ncbi:MAG: ATP-dependent Clp protease ATP-binding subunit [bacterium]|nr:MAG: ATP-dependent Clp protease ATP-binding subunit [bacterium]
MTEPLVGLLGIIIIIIVTLYFSGKQTRQLPLPPSQPQPTSRASGIAQIYQIAANIKDFFDFTAHPKDLLDFPEFMNGVKLLEKSDLKEDALIEYFAGGNIIISCMALEALNRRSISQETVDKIVSFAGRCYLWPIYFVLRTVSNKSKNPVIGAIIAQAKEWWAQDRLLIQMLEVFISERLEKKEQPTFGNLLEKLDSNSLAFVHNLVNALNQDRLQVLIEELSQLKKEELDVDYLNSFGRLWNQDESRELVFEQSGIINNTSRLISTVFNAPFRSAVLVGEPGVGKTAVLHLLNSKIKNMKWRIFEASAHNVLAGQIYIGQLEERIYNLVKNLDTRYGIVWYVPHIHELLYAGRHSRSPIGLLEMLFPYIEAGNIRIIGETHPAGLQQMINEHKQINSLFEVIRIEPLNDEETLTLAIQWAGSQIKDKTDRTVADEATLKEGLNLVKQFLSDQETPGSLLNLLKLTWRRLRIASATTQKLRTDDLIVSLSQLTGLPQSIIDDRMDLDLSQLRDHFQERVLGQTEAVESLIERVAMIKAGLTDPTRPAGVFLFVGPTGTGKTEIAKTLSEFLFGSPDRMIRLDMSEFQNQESLSSILGDPYDRQDSSTLVSQIRKQPFSVVLLDEFEKAHPKVWDVFLQVFDDGRLTSRYGNTADFRHSIIILTSNLGAKLQTGESIGFTTKSSIFSLKSVEKAVAQTFRKEFINRLDRVIIFHPLSRTVMRDILNNELMRAFQRRGLRTRDWAIEWEDSAIDFLLEKGFTQDLGARPLKRAIDRYLMTTLAMTIVNRQVPEGDQFLFIRSDGNSITVEFIDPNGPAPEALADTPVGEVPGLAKFEVPAGLEIKSILLDAYGNRNEAEFLQQEYQAYHEMINSDDWVERKQQYLKETHQSGFWDSEDRFVTLGEIEYMDRIETALNTAGRLLDRLLGNRPETRTSFSPKLVKQLAQQLYLISEAYSTYEEKLPKDAYLKIEAQPKMHKETERVQEFFEQIIHMYRSWSEKRRMRMLVLHEVMDAVRKEFQFLAAVSGFGSYSILQKETGLHVLEVPKTPKTHFKYNVNVRVCPQPEKPVQNQEAILDLAKQAFSEQKETGARIVRHYRLEPSPLVRDNIHKWRTGRIERVLEGDFDLMG